MPPDTSHPAPRTSLVARKELLDMARDGRFRAAAVIVLSLLTVSLATGWRQHREVSRQHELAQKVTREHWLKQGTKNPHSAAHYGVYAFKPKSPLALIDQGADAYTGVAVWLEAHKQNEFKYRPAQDQNTLARFGELTAATVLQALVPLLIILMAFSAFAGEREQGTLRQLLSLGVPRRTLAFGKALGVAGGLGLLLVPAAALGSAALALTSGGATSAVLPRAAWLAVSYLLYFGAFVGVSLAASAWCRSARLALVVLLAFWVGNCLIAPRAAADLAKRAHPTPSSFAFAKAVEGDLQNGLDGHNPADQRLEQLKRRALQRYNVDSLDKLPVSFVGLSLAEGEEHGNRVFDHHYGALWDQFERQNRLQQAAAALAPLLAVRSLSMGMAGTDFEQFRHFAAAAEQYRRHFIQVMNDDILRNANRAGSGPYLRGDDLWRQVAEFDYDAPSVSWVLRRQATGLLLLTAWLALSAALAYLAVSRLQVD